MSVHIVQCCILVVLSVQFVQSEPEIPYNPCPELFRYYSEGDQWYGNITIPTPTSSPAVLKISFSIEDINIKVSRIITPLLLLTLIVFVHILLGIPITIFSSIKNSYIYNNLQMYLYKSILCCRIMVA